MPRKPKDAAKPPQPAAVAVAAAGASVQQLPLMSGEVSSPNRSPPLAAHRLLCSAKQQRLEIARSLFHVASQINAIGTFVTVL